jgi:hypothetical protein
MAPTVHSALEIDPSAARSSRSIAAPPSIGSDPTGNSHGVPMSVPSPPMLPAYAIPSRRATAKARRAASPAGSPPRRARAITDVAMGSIMTTVAELLTHMLMDAVAAMKPRMRLAGRVPTTPRTGWKRHVPFFIRRRRSGVG